MKHAEFRPEFVEFIPRELEEGVLYISEKYKTASHKCACGCGEKVVTPLSPVEWQLLKLRGKVSLSPSIGNWNYACKSHYLIKSNKVVWAGAMSSRQIALVQKKDRVDKERYVDALNRKKELTPETEKQADTVPQGKSRDGLWNRILSQIRSFFN